MSPSIERPLSPAFEEKPGLEVLGLGVQYPEFHNGPDVLGTIAKKFYPDSEAMTKVLRINEFTGIDTKAAIGMADHPIVNGVHPPGIDALGTLFLDLGVKLSVSACRQAIEQWGGDLSDITHVVSTTCTSSANPGFDQFVVKELGLDLNVEKVLLHGVGCSGGLAALRTAAHIAQGSSFRRRPARILILACEICSVLVRSELDSINESQEVRIGATLFSDCASAMILSNGIRPKNGEEPLLELLGWEHRTLEDTVQDLGFDVHPFGWKVVLTPRVPKVTGPAVPLIFDSLISSISPSHLSNNLSPTDFDWALHPGGSTIITNVENIMGLTPEHLRASYETYIEHGNSSSATVFSVMKRLLDRDQEGARRNVVSCAFGPGISVEMCVFRRCDGIWRGSEDGIGSGTSSLSESVEELLQAEPVD